jgi:hypothetical protein
MTTECYVCCSPDTVHTAGLSCDRIITEYTNAEHRVMLFILNISALIVERVMTQRNAIYLIRFDVIQMLVFFSNWRWVSMRQKL